VYPNPSFAQPVTITYEVKDEKSPVTVTLFSMSGIKQFETVNVMQSAGVHQQVIPAEYLTNQVGILKIINGNYMATQKIVVY
jgi:hypothetical protein